MKMKHAQAEVFIKNNQYSFVFILFDTQQSHIAAIQHYIRHKAYLPNT